MKRTFIDILHGVMTNQLIILAVAIALFLLVILLSDHSHSEAVTCQFWCQLTKLPDCSCCIW
jgi:hypothetical protein